QLAFRARYLLFELRQRLTFQRTGYWQFGGLRIHMLAGYTKLIMQMRAGCRAGGAHIGDHIALLDLLPLLQPAGETAHVAVQSGVLAMMLEDDRIAITTLHAFELDDAVGGGMDGRTGRCGVIHTL